MWRDVDSLGDNKQPWLVEFALSFNFMGAPEDLLEATVCCCARENLGLDVAGKQCIGAQPRLVPLPT